MKTVECATQAEVDAARSAGHVAIVRSGTFSAYGSATVRAYGSATVWAYGSATVRAYGSATVWAYDSATVWASPNVAVHDHGPDVTVTGGVHIKPDKSTPEAWANHYGVEVSRGWLTVYKAVDADLKSGHGFAYPVGTEVACDDWDDGGHCGNGLHFSPHPFMALRYLHDASRFLECRVKASEVVLLDDKLKAPRCKVVREVNIDGEAL